MLRVAIIGAGRGSGLIPIFQAHPITEVALVCDIVLDRAKALAERQGVPVATDSFDEVCDRDDVDLLYIATPPDCHVPQSVRALAANKHVLCEVPALWELHEAKELVSAVQTSQAQYMMAENMAYFAWVQSFERMIAEGYIGDPVYAECEYVHDLRERMSVPESEAQEGDRRTWRARIGPAQYCTHDLGPILRMFHDRVATVVGMSTSSHTLPELGVIDAEAILCRTVGGRVAKFLGSFVNARSECFHYFSVYGTRGVLESPRTSGEPYRLWGDAIPYAEGPVAMRLGANHPELVGKVPGGGHGTCEWLMVDDFLRAIEDGVRPPVDVFEALDWSLPGLLGHLSALEDGKPMAVPDPRQWI